MTTLKRKSIIILVFRYYNMIICISIMSSKVSHEFGLRKEKSLLSPFDTLIF